MLGSFKNDYKRIGKLGEDIAIEFLKEHNYKIIERNFACKQGEVDIIAKEKNEYVFCEVKTRRSIRCGKPIDSVNLNKKYHIWNVTKYYLYKNNLMNKNIRFDVIEVYIKGKLIYINHVKRGMF